jgi:predicted permease
LECGGGAAAFLKFALPLPLLIAGGMRIWSPFRTLLDFLFRRPRVEREMEEELHSHLRSRADDLQRQGLSRAEAERQAHIEFGGYQRYKEECREALGTRLLGELIADIRYGLRQLRRNPGFTAVAVITLALGIGANTAIFSVVNTVLLRLLPYKDADRLVTVWSYNKSRGFDTDQVSQPDFDDWRSENHVFDSMAASTEAEYTLTGSGKPVLIIAYAFSADYFHVLGVRPLLGRTFLPQEDQPGKNHVAVLSYPFWESRFGGKRNVIGKTITLNGAPYAVVGVMPPGFQYPPFTELWTPLTVSPEAASNRGYRYLRVMARLKPAVTIQQAQTEMNTIARRLALAYPKTNKHEDATNLISLRQKISGDIRPALLILLCAVGLVLLIACVNVANLLLARAAGRQKEIAVRIALGARRQRIVRQFLTESVLLGVAAGALAIPLAFWSTPGLVAMFPPSVFNVSIPHIQKIPIDGHVLGFALAVSLLSGLLFGLIPALQASHTETIESLKESGRSLGGGVRGRRVRDALVVSEVALSLMLLIAAGLTLKSLAHLLAADLGFDAHHVLTMRVLLPGYKYKTDAQEIAFSDRALDGIKSLPGVEAAGTVTFLPLSGWGGDRTVGLEGQSTPPNQRPMVSWSSVTPDYFRAMGIPLLRGRFFDRLDIQGVPAVAIVSESLAHHLSPNMNPVGKRIEVQGLKSPAEIVGVVRDLHQLGITSGNTSEVYLPFSQVPAPIICFAIRTASDPLSLAKAAERAIWVADKDQSIGYVMPMSELASESLAPERVGTLLLVAFAGLALLLAAIGIYGVIAYSAAQRTHEIGIRMALGAQKHDVLTLVVGQGMRVALTGVAIGMVGALGLTRFLSSLLYAVKPTDPLTFIAVPLILTGVALLASYVPARRATKVDPMVALRHE